MDSEDVQYYMKALAKGASYIFAIFAFSFALLGLYGAAAPNPMLGCFSVGAILLHAFAVKPEKAKLSIT
jgi:cell division protein FtsX